MDRLVADGAAAMRVGVRINPQVGIGSIEAMSTAGRTTKFGIAMADPGNRERLLAAYAARPWLRWVHVHVGSQGIPLELNAAGVAEAVRFAREVNARRAGQIEGIDIGGGLPVDFSGDGDSPTFADHVAVLRDAAPELFSGELKVVTEYGRAVMAKNGFIASRVEYTKSTGGRAIALTHAGAQVAARTVFAPKSWPLRVLAYDRYGLPSTAELEVQDVAGPCCFAGIFWRGSGSCRSLLPRMSSWCRTPGRTTSPRRSSTTACRCRLFSGSRCRRGMWCVFTCCVRRRALRSWLLGVVCFRRACGEWVLAAVAGWVGRRRDWGGFGAAGCGGGRWAD